MSLSSNQITATAPTSTVTLTLRDGAGAPLAARVVSVATVRGLGSLPTATVLTDSAGVATATLQAAAGGAGGADEVRGSIVIDGVTIAGLAAFQVVQTGAATGQPALALGLSSSTISSASPAVVTATVLDARGQPIAGRVVNFVSARGLGALSATTALTDSAGRAVVSLSPASSTTGGADEVTATASVAGTALTDTRGFQLLVTPVSISALTSNLGGGTLSAYGQATLTLTLSGASAGAPINLALGSACVTQGKATISPATFTASTATSSFQYRDNGCGALQGEDVIQARIVGATASPTTLNLPLASPAINSIAFVSASPSSIFLRGSGLTESSVVVFELRDTAGNALPNQALELSLANSAGGITLEGTPGPVTRRTDAQGRVSVIVNAGTVPTTVRIVAQVVGTQIKTVSSGLGIAVGLPSQLNFSMSQNELNIEGFNIDGTTNAYRIIASDRSGNAVPDGTSINFVTEGGQVEAIKQTALTGGIARASASFVSSSPRPVDGRITVTAYAVGEESFLDANGNNVYDAGELFQDLGDIFKDTDFNTQFGSAEEFISLTPLLPNNGVRSTCAATPTSLLSLFVGESSVASVPNTCDGVWGRAYVRRSVETVLSTSSSEPVWLPGAAPAINGGTILLRTDPTSATTPFALVAGSSVSNAGQSGVLNLLIRDANRVRLNPVAARSVISATATAGLTVRVNGGSPVPSSSEATATAISYEFADLPSPQSGVITVSVTSPGGLTSGVVLNIAR